MARTEQFHVLWKVYPQQDLIQMSGILSGLATLAQQRAISLSFEQMERGVLRNHAWMELVVTHAASGSKRNVVIDYYDDEGRIIPSALEFSDYYFKRQFGPASRRAVGSDAAAKIVPLGLTIAGYSRTSWRPLLAAVRALPRTREVRRPTQDSSVFRHILDDLRLWLSLPAPDAAVMKDSDIKEAHIVFQPRLWPTMPGSGDLFEVANYDRIATVRALKLAFPNERGIGLLTTGRARELASDLVLDSNVTTQQYHRQLRSSLLAVNCVGLSGSIGWKFAEYLAAGNAIVSQPISKEFLAPIEANVHYLPYASPEECVAQCHRLLNDRSLAARMSKINREYFQRWVNPPAHVSHLLKRVFD